MKISDQVKFLRSRMYLLAAILVVAAIILLIIINRSTLVVTATPNGAVVTLDNAPLNSLPNGTSKIMTKPGNHTLKVEADGYVAQIMNLNLTGGRSRAVTIDLTEVPKPIILPLATSPDLSVDSITLGDKENSVFFLGTNKSAIYDVDFKGDRSVQYVSQLTNPGFSGITDIIWSPKKDAAIFKKDTRAYYFDFQKYNFVSQQEVKYGEDIGDIAWAPDDSKIAYYYAPASGEQSLIFSDRTNANIRRMLNLKELGISNPFILWSPSSEWLLIIPRNTDTSTNKIYLFSAYTTAIKTITDVGNKIGASFSPDGKKIIFSSASNNPSNPVKSEISIMNNDGTEIKDLGVNALISKIAWIDNSNIAVATYDPETKAESLFKFNTDNKQKIGFSIPLSGLFVNSLLVSPDGKILYFLANNHLYQIAL